MVYKTETPHTYETQLPSPPENSHEFIAQDNAGEDTAHAWK